MPIALVTSQQHESLVDLLCEPYAYYNNDSPFRLVVATHADRGVVGFAAIALIYSLADPTRPRASDHKVFA
jgi:hypothetical protein